RGRGRRAGREPAACVPRLRPQRPAPPPGGTSARTRVAARWRGDTATARAFERHRVSPQVAWSLLALLLFPRPGVRTEGVATRRPEAPRTEGGRRHQPINSVGDLFFVEEAILVLIRLLEEDLRGFHELLKRHLAVLVGVGAFEQGFRQARPQA